jgi:formiminoglutamase
VRFKATLKSLARVCDAIVVSWDLDSANEGDAPGVSAPQAEGFSSTDLIEMMEIAGAEKKVVSLGIFELNPHHDEHDKTARLAATGAFHFLLNKHSTQGKRKS